MGFASGVIGAVKEFRARRRKEALHGLLQRTAALRKRLDSQKGRLGISGRRTPGKDYYRRLGIGSTADRAKIRKAYIGLMKRYHPDINRSPGAEEAAKEINEAYKVLSDGRLKEEYDAMVKGVEEGADEQAARRIAVMVMTRYSDMRREEFADLKAAVAQPLERAAFVGYVEGFLDWRGTFAAARKEALQELAAIRSELARLRRLNKRLAAGMEGEGAHAISSNADSLREMEEDEGYSELNVLSAVKIAEAEVRKREKELARELRGNIY